MRGAKRRSNLYFCVFLKDEIAEAPLGALAMTEGRKKYEIATLAFGGRAMIVPLVVIASSEATKQSIFLCLSKRRDCHGLPWEPSQ